MMLRKSDKRAMTALFALVLTVVPILGEGRVAAQVEGPGIVDAHTWVSPLYGTTLTWSDEWAVTLDAGGAPVVRSTTTGPLLGDSICIDTVAETDRTRICVNLMPVNPESHNAANWQSNYAVPEATSVYGTRYYGVQVTDTGYVMATSAVDGSSASIGTGLIDPSGAFHSSVSLQGTTETLPDVLEKAQAGVKVNGAPAFASIDPAVFRAENDAMLTELPALQEQQAANLAEVGYTAPGTFTSATMSCEVTWTEPLVLQMRALQPFSADLRTHPETGEDRDAVTFQLTAGENRDMVLNAWCYQPGEPVPPASDYEPYGEDFVLDGTGVQYHLYKWTETTYTLLVVVDPTGAPGVELEFEFSTPAQMQELVASSEPGALVVNGVDVFEAMRTDGVADQIP